MTFRGAFPPPRVGARPRSNNDDFKSRLRATGCSVRTVMLYFMVYEGGRESRGQYTGAINNAQPYNNIYKRGASTRRGQRARGTLRRPIVFAMYIRRTGRQRLFIYIISRNHTRPYYDRLPKYLMWPIWSELDSCRVEEKRYYIYNILPVERKFARFSFRFSVTYLCIIMLCVCVTLQDGPKYLFLPVK